MRTIRDYKPEVLSLWRRLVSVGFKIRGVSNDGETLIKAEGKTEDELIEELLGADDGWLYVISPNGRRTTLYLVYGNEPGVIVSDHSASIPILDIIVAEHYKEWAGKEQPQQQVPD